MCKIIQSRVTTKINWIYCPKLHDATSQDAKKMLLEMQQTGLSSTKYGVKEFAHRQSLDWSVKRNFAFETQMCLLMNTIDQCKMRSRTLTTSVMCFVKQRLNVKVGEWHCVAREDAMRVTNKLNASILLSPPYTASNENYCALA